MQDAAEDSRPEKRQRMQELDTSGNDVCQDTVDPAEAPPSGPPPAQQLTAALQKIANHISNSSKFAKASQLLRQIMDAVDKPHSDDFFAAVKAAFIHPEHCIDPLLRKDYMRLIKAVNLRSDVFNKQQRAQLEVYTILALTQNELFTDDSFVFNKVVTKIKSSISELPEGDEEQEAAWVKLFPEEAAAHGITAPPPPAAAVGTRHGATEAKHKQQQSSHPAAAESGGGAEEADPFGLDAFIAKAEAEAAAAAEAGAAAAAAAAAQNQPDHVDPGEAGPSQSSDHISAAGQQHKPKSKLTWDPTSCLVMKKQAWLSCIETAKIHQHKLAWARTSIELLIEDVAKPTAQGGFIGKFVGTQRQQLLELLKFVNAERAARRSGVNRRPGGKGTGDYVTSFEKARAEWGSASWVSARGKIGGQGDAKQQNWLG